MPEPSPSVVRSPALTGLFVLALFYTLWVARGFFLPVVLALLLSFLLSPVVRTLGKLRIPRGLGAGLVIFGLLGSLGLGVFELAEPAIAWAEKAPRQLRRLERKLVNLKKPVETMSKATRQVEVTAGGAVTVILLFFLLASGDRFLHKLIGGLPSLEDKSRAVAIARQIEREVSAYLVTITGINLGLGLAVWGALTLVGVPNPLLWGALAFVANFIPYLGTFLMVAVLAMVGFLTFNDTGRALLAPGIFLALHLVESYLVTPLAVGRRLTLHPVMIFLGLTFWGWLWGIPGALLAVPILVVVKIICDHSEPLRPVGELLGD
jgi:predicted PurR-regulated permease PerM